jgi:hypothetical protein
MSEAYDAANEVAEAIRFSTEDLSALKALSNLPTVRDLFAAFAMNGIITRYGYAEPATDFHGEVALEAYRFADAMLRASEMSAKKTD